MKIAHLTTVDLSLRYLVLPQLEAAAEVGEAIGISAPGPYVEELQQLGIRHLPLASSTRGMNLRADLLAARDLWRHLRREKIDILHTHNPKPGLYGRLVGRLAGVPMVVNTVHGLYATPDDPLVKRLVVYGLEALASRFSDAELVQNPEDLELLRRWRIASPRKLSLLGNGVDLQRFYPERVRARREELRSEWGVEPHQVVVGIVGRLVAEKGYPELFAAAEMLDSRFVVVAAGPDDPDKPDALPREMLEQAAAAGVRFLGMRRDVEDLYGAFDLFVLPSHREGFPRAAMEAAASGLPVVATDIRGCRQVVAHGENGLLVPVRSPEALAEAISAIGADEQLRRRMGEAAVRKAQRVFDERRVVERVMETYRRVAKRKGLDWALAHETADTGLRPAEPRDLAAVAQLHRRGIHTGFLAALGRGFLEELYLVMLADPRSTVIVAEADGAVVGFIAGTAHTGAFYKRFLRTRSLRAAARAGWRLVRPAVLRKAYETFRYGSSEDDGADEAAELLAMAVAHRFRGRGLGRDLVGALLTWAEEQSLQTMRVVVGAGNEAAITLYQRCGFGDPRPREVHAGSPSWELVWRR